MSRSREQIREDIRAGRTAIGIEFGSTRIKAVLVDSGMSPAAQGNYEWENRLENGVWTYPLEEIIQGLQSCYRNLAGDVRKRYGIELETAGSLGISAMMHGYMAFDRKGELLVPFRTWRNTMTGEAARELTEMFSYNIPQRWSIAHLYQAMLNREPHLRELDFMTTLAGYIHWRLTGRKVLGVGDASGMFPIDSGTGTYNSGMAEKFEKRREEMGYSFSLLKLLPDVLPAGENAGTLTEEGAALLDPTGTLKAGIPLCPPEGDAGTGMTATNSVAVRTGNVSAGTSVFSMIVLERELKKVHPEIDMVTTPDGKPVAMVHCNNCTSDLNAWVGLFGEFAQAAGTPLEPDQLYGLLYREALKGDADCGGLFSCGYLSGEPITEFEEGRPMFFRLPDSRFSLANFMRSHLYSSLATLKIGMDLLTGEEGVRLDCLMGHGGLFKTEGVGQRIMAAAASAAVSVMETAGEGGPWGMALLAAYMEKNSSGGRNGEHAGGEGSGRGETLEEFLNAHVFSESRRVTVEPDEEDVRGFQKFLNRFKAGLSAERAAVEAVRE